MRGTSILVCVPCTTHTPVERKLHLSLRAFSALQGAITKSTKMAIAPPLNIGWGYGIVLGLGAVFAFGMVGSVPWPLSNLIHGRTDEIRSSSRGSSNGTTMNCKRPRCSVRLEGR